MQHRDLGLLLRSLQSEEATDQRLAPRLARTFQQHLRQTLTPEGHRAWSDKTIQRILTNSANTWFTYMRHSADWIFMTLSGISILFFQALKISPPQKSQSP